MNSVLDRNLDQNLNQNLDHDQSAGPARQVLRNLPVTARAGVVNRTHRIVRERAQVLQQKRSRDRSLMLPLIVCSVLLILCALAIWTGLYQYQAVEAVQSDISSLTDSNDHSLVVLLWFVPVLLAFLTTLWVRRSRNNPDSEAR